MMKNFGMGTVLLLAGFLGPVNADVLDPEDVALAEALMERALEGRLAYELVADLTTTVGHRMAGTPNDAMGVEWAVDTLRDLGFENVRTETFSFPYWRRGEESLEVLDPYHQTLVVTALGGSPGTPEEGIEGEVVAVPDYETLLELPADAVRGRIVFIPKRMARHRDGTGYSDTVNQRSRGPYLAAEKGALALVIRSVGTSFDRFTHTGNISSSLEGPKVPAAAVSNPDADQLERMLARGPVRLRLKLDVGYAGEARSHNVIGEIPGAVHPGEIVLLGAHLDSWDLGTGAVDDGSGVGIVMAAAKLILDLDRPPERTVRVVLFGNEEQGLYGAKAYRDAHADEVENHVIAAESDFGAGPIYNLETKVVPEAMVTLKAIHQVLAPLGIEWSDKPASGGADLSPMRDAGMAVVDLSQDASEYFDLHHTANDTLDKVDPEVLARNTAAYAAFAWLVANSETDFGSGERLEATE